MDPSATYRRIQGVSRKAGQFTESVIREMTRQAMKYGAVNLAQGFPDFPAPLELKDAAKAAIDADINQYAITWGAKRFRDAIAAKTERFLGLTIDPETEITVCCGSTEAMIASLLAALNPGDEVVIFEPFYENYGPDSILADAVPRFARLRPERDGRGWQWRFDERELKALFNNHTRAMILNTPNNPTGKVFTREEMEILAGLCQMWNVVCFTDEIYEHIVYGESPHIAMATLPGMRERTVTINGMSKTYSVTGWRVGWAIAPPPLTAAIRKVHDFLTVGAAAPLQEAGALACSLDSGYYTALAEGYRRRRDRFLPALEDAGFTCYAPDGAYYVMTDISGFGFASDLDFANYLVKDIGVSVVPGSSFYQDPAGGAQQVRFCFCKRDETLDEAGRRLGRLSRPS
jgi:aminotransferase